MTTSTNTFTSHHLFDKAFRIDYEGSGMISVSKMLEFGFFPGGYGTYDKSPTLAGRDIMVVGQDYGTRSYYAALDQKGESESGSATWRNMLSLLNLAGVPHERCFFTNLFMGLRDDRENKGVSMTSPLKARNVSSYVNDNLAFFQHQLDTLAPKAVLILGREPAKCLAALFPALSTWNKSFRKIDESGTGIVTVTYNGKPIDFLLLTHPSFAHINRRNRGADVEVKLLRETCSS